MALEDPAPPHPPARTDDARAALGPPAPPADAFAIADLRWSPQRLDAILEVVLSAPARVGASVVARQLLPRLATLLAAVAVLGAIPYGIALGLPFWWRIPVLYLGSTLICLPSLHVFGTYLGLRVSVVQNLTLAMTIPAVAAVFSLGFAPILAFLRWTVTPGDTGSTLAVLSALLLLAALAAGVGQLWRCVATVRPLIPRGGQLLLLGWHSVFLYVVARMANVLELTP